MVITHGRTKPYAWHPLAQVSTYECVITIPRPLFTMVITHAHTKPYAWRHFAMVLTHGRTKPIPHHPLAMVITHGCSITYAGGRYEQDYTDACVITSATRSVRMVYTHTCVITSARSLSAVPKHDQTNRTRTRPGSHCGHTRTTDRAVQLAPFAFVEIIPTGRSSATDTVSFRCNNPNGQSRAADAVSIRCNNPNGQGQYTRFGFRSLYAEASVRCGTHDEQEQR